jgi:hypothetical protein
MISETKSWFLKRQSKQTLDRQKKRVKAKLEMKKYYNWHHRNKKHQKKLL